MCPPDNFEIAYQINPWMQSGQTVDTHRAAQQWRELRSTYRRLGHEVLTIKPQPGLPDMVFTANGGLVRGQKAALPVFRHAERQPETNHFAEWFQAYGLAEILIPQHPFEGEGDALVSNGRILAGYGFRSDRRAHDELAAFFDMEVISLQLVDPRFYHIDTCLAVLNQQTIAFYPPAFDKSAQAVLRNLCPKVIEASQEDALAFGLNMFSDGQNVVMSPGAKSLIAQVQAAGFNVYPVAVDEFKKSGGGIKCLTLTMHQI